MIYFLKYNQKKRFASLMLAGLFISFSTHASISSTHIDPNWYIGGFLGSNFSANGDTQIPSIAAKPPLKSQPVYKTAPSFGLNIGYRFLQSFRMEAEIAYQNLPTHKINNAIGPGTVTYVDNSYTNLFSLFMNGYYDFNRFPSWIIYPYIGAGAGYVNVKNQIRPATPIPVSPVLFFTKKELNYDTWGFQGMLGLVYPVTEHIHASVDYKYFSTLTKEARGQTNLGPDSYQTKQKVTDNMVTLGSTYFFS